LDWRFCRADRRVDGGEGFLREFVERFDRTFSLVLEVRVK
jgi:hypothetical protein